MREADICALRPSGALPSPQLRRRGSRTLREAHHDGIAFVGGAAESFANLVLILDLDAARRKLPPRRREVGLHGSIGRQRKHGAAVLAGIELLAHAPPGFRTLVIEVELA